MDASTYHLAIITTLAPESSALLSMLDCPPIAAPVPTTRTYIFGHILNHNVVIATLPTGIPGIAAASTTAHDLAHDFPHIKACLVLGIAGGIPRPDQDIRLGDVVVRVSDHGEDAVKYYGRGKYHGRERGAAEFEHCGRLHPPSERLLTAVAAVRAEFETSMTEMKRLIAERGTKFAGPGSEDVLFESEYRHQSPQGTPCTSCDISHSISRPPRPSTDPMVHFGTIISSNAVIASAEVRDTIHDALGGLCLETEAAGVMDVLPTLVIRGISDYADSHKNDEWHAYASLTACAFARVLIGKLAIAEQNQKQNGKIKLQWNNSGVQNSQLVQGMTNYVNMGAFSAGR